MNIYLFILLFITGILSSYTDITKKKIKNILILIIFILALLIYVVLIVLKKLPFSFLLIVNPLVALIIGFIFFSTGLWKAGDAKLFFIYSLLLHHNKYRMILPLTCLVLFVNTFLICLAFIMLLFVKKIISFKSIKIKKVINYKIFIYISKSFFVTFTLTWILIPILGFLPFKDIIFLKFIFLYFGYIIIYKIIDILKYKIIIIPVLISGFILRYIIMPESFYFLNLLNYLKHLLIYSLVFYMLRNAMQPKEKTQRIPLAPFMFLGAILSNTDFLGWIIRILNYLRK